MRTIYCLGNVLEEKDATIPRLLSELQAIRPDDNFVLTDPTELDELNDQPIFIDTVIGIEQVEVFTSINGFTPPPRITVHDYDLYHNLSLMKKLHKISEFKIIGVPPQPITPALVQQIASLLED